MYQRRSKDCTQRNEKRTILYELLHDKTNDLFYVFFCVQRRPGQDGSDWHLSNLIGVITVHMKKVKTLIRLGRCLCQSELWLDSKTKIIGFVEQWPVYMLRK